MKTKLHNLKGGAKMGCGLPLELFGEAIKRIRGFSPAKTAGFLHKNGKRACPRTEAAGAPQIFIITRSIQAFTAGATQIFINLNDFPLLLKKYIMSNYELHLWK